MWYSNRRRSGSWPFFFLPCCRSPPSGVGSASAAWRVLSFTCAMPCGVFLAWLACWLLSWKFTFLFRAAGLSAGCLGFSASLLPGEGSWFLRLAWRYGRCFWRRPFPYTWCFPDAGGNVSVSTSLGWFAILEVLVLKSRDSRFSWSLTLLAWCFEFWVPYPVAPFRGWLSGSSDRRVGLAELRRTSGLVLQSLCSLSTCPWPGLCGFGVIHVWVFSGSPSGCECCVLCFVMLT